MASIALLSLPISSPKCCKYQIPALNKSQFLSANSLLRLKKQTLYSSIHIKQLNNLKGRASPIVCAAQFNPLGVIQTAWKVGFEGAVSLVPGFIPRRVARFTIGLVLVVLAFLAFLPQLKALMMWCFKMIGSVDLFVYFILFEGLADWPSYFTS